MFKIHRHFTAAPPPFPAETNLGNNMVIGLAALLYALIGALVVNSIIRCVWRRWWRAAARVERQELEAIPVAVFEGEGRMRMRGTECAICLGEFESGEDLRILPRCNHGFHVHCIDAWLVSHSSCPNCRHSVPLKTVGDGGSGGISELRRPGNHRTHTGQLSDDIIIILIAAI